MTCPVCKDLSECSEKIDWVCPPEQLSCRDGVTSVSVCCFGSLLCLLITLHCASLLCLRSLFVSISSFQTAELQRQASRLLGAWQKHFLSVCQCFVIPDMSEG